MTPVNYAVELWLNGTLIGDVRRMAESLSFTRRRTTVGVDAISFNINDRLFEAWLNDRNTTLRDVLKPLALECRIRRGGVYVIGGFLAAMPGYQPMVASATLALNFDGYLNLLAGVYLSPAAYTNQAMEALVEGWIEVADTRAERAGKAFGLTIGYKSKLAKVDQTFDDYKNVKEAIADRSDNVSGAGRFDVYFHADKTYDVVADVEFGTERSYSIEYPARINGVSAASISADEVQGFASSVIGLGAGETSADPTLSTAITNQQTNTEAVLQYGYAESLLQESSISVVETLQRKVATSLSQLSNTLSEPKITLSGRQVAPTPQGEAVIWLGDIVNLRNSVDPTGAMSGRFRVEELQVAVSASNAETITPTLERVEDEFSLAGGWTP